MFARLKTVRSDVLALENVEAMVRTRFALSDDDLVLVSEERADTPGLPERSTLVLFWTGRETRHRLRVFRSPVEVTFADLPPGWLRGALLDDGENDCC